MRCQCLWIVIGEDLIDGRIGQRGALIVKWEGSIRHLMSDEPPAEATIHGALRNLPRGANCRNRPFPGSCQP